MYKGLYTILITIYIVTTIAISLFCFFEGHQVIGFITVKCYPQGGRIRDASGDFGFGTLVADFEFWRLVADYEFWTLVADVGLWILDFGPKCPILNFVHQCTIFRFWTLVSNFGLWTQILDTGAPFCVSDTSG